MADSNYPVTSNAVAVPILSLIALLLDTPPFICHVRNRNLGASSLVFWLILTNLINFVNALIWPTDDIKNWFDGKGLCDVEVKLIVAGYIGICGALVSIMRSLARVLDTENTVLSPSQAQKRRQNAIDILLCIVAPVYMMSIHYVVQPTRYYIFAIAGCQAPFDNSWPTLALVFIWPPIFCLVVVGYSILVILRMHKYRKNFASILNSSNSNLTKSRFLRLFWVAMGMILTFFPYQVYVLYANAIHPLLPYSWDLIHSPDWYDITLVPEHGNVNIREWVEIAYGFGVFLVFGLGHDAKEMYRTWLLRMGLGRVFPRLERDGNRNAAQMQSSSMGSQDGSTGSRARLFLIRKFRGADAAGELPNKEISPSNSSGLPSPAEPDLEKHAQSHPQPSYLNNDNNNDTPTPTEPPQSRLHRFITNISLTLPNLRLGGLGGMRTGRRGLGLGFSRGGGGDGGGRDSLV